VIASKSVTRRINPTRPPSSPRKCSSAHHGRPSCNPMSAKPRLTSKLLEKYYATVKSLRLYLDEILEEIPVPLTAGDADSPAYTNLLNTSIVGLKTEEQPPRRFRYAPPMSPIRDVCNSTTPSCARLNNATGNREGRRETSESRRKISAAECDHRWVSPRTSHKYSTDVCFPIFIFMCIGRAKATKKHPLEPC
jgi:hypothetical protein